MIDILFGICIFIGFIAGWLARRSMERSSQVIATELTAQAARFMGAAIVLEEGAARRQLVSCAHMLRTRAADILTRENLSKDDRTPHRLIV